MEQKMTIVAKEGIALIGNAFHVLEDKTTGAFNTNDVEAFKAFIATKYDFALFYNQNEISAVPTKDLNQHSAAIACLKLIPSAALHAFSRALGQKIGIDDFELLLLTMRPYITDDGMKLLNNLREFKVSKVSEIIRSKDNKGNYAYSYKRTGSGAGDFTPPNTVAFILPVFEGIEDKIKIDAEFLFDYSEVEDEDDEDKKEISFVFTLRCLDFAELLRIDQQKILAKIITAFSQPKYWGSFSIQKNTDSWKYLANGLPR